ARGRRGGREADVAAAAAAAEEPAEEATAETSAPAAGAADHDRQALAGRDDGRLRQRRQRDRNHGHLGLDRLLRRQGRRRRGAWRHGTPYLRLDGLHRPFRLDQLAALVARARGLGLGNVDRTTDERATGGGGGEFRE